jgi:ABC-type transport system substrate-binding protein
MGLPSLAIVFGLLGIGLDDVRRLKRFARINELGQVGTRARVKAPGGESAFKIEVRNVSGAQLFQNQHGNKIPFDFVGWIEDFHDPHNWVYAALGSAGYYGRLAGIDAKLQQELDRLILQDAMGARLDRAEYDRHVDAMQAAMSEDEFAKAWAEGRVMTLEQAIAYALAEK